MTRHAFDALVRRIEGRYSGRQASLERATTRWVAMGLAGMLSWLLLLAGLGILFFALGAIAEPPASLVLIAIGVPIALYAVFQALYILRVELDPPDGHLLAPGEAPELKSLLDGLGRDLGCRPFDEVRITMDLNAAVRELPRLGLLGWPRMILEIGLPLAQAMSPDELKAIVAHEYAHLSGRHGRSISRIYRLNRTWGNLFQRMQKPTGDSFTRMSRSAISKFVGWYWPRLHARSLVLSRAHEFQADREAARIAGGHAMATALWRLEGLSPRINERFWPDLFANAADCPEPPADVASRISLALRTPPTAEDAALWADRVLNRATVHDETHPALLDRVRPLGLTADDLRAIGFPAAPSPSAAETLLGDLVPTIERELSEAWRKETLGPWRDRYRKGMAEARRKAATTVTTSTAAVAEADVHALWESAREAANLKGPAPAVPLLRLVLDRDPEHDGASVILGRHLAIAGDPEGEAMLTRVLDRNDEAWVPGACEALQEVYRASGRTDLLREINARLDRHESDLQAARRERSTIAASDPFLPHDLADEQLAPLRGLLASIPDVGAAWIVRKRLQYFPKRLLFLLCVRGTAARWWSSNSDREQALVRRLIPKVELPGQVLVIANQGSFRALAKAIRKSPGSEVYRREAGPAPPSA